MARTPYAASIRVRPRANGTTAYDVRYRVDGQSKTLTFENAASADKWANIVRKVGPVQAIEFLGISTKAGTPTVEEYLEVYLASRSGLEPRTINDYRTYMRMHIAPVIGHLPIDAVSKATIAAWVNGMQAGGSSSKSIKNRHGFLSAMFQNAVDDGLIPSNPCNKTRLPESERREMVFLSTAEFDTLLSYIPTFYKPLVLLLAATGMRWSEATALRPGDFDFNRREVRISRAWKRDNKGYYIGPPKTKRSKRTIDLPPNLIPTIEPLVKAAGEYVFTNTRGRPLQQNSFWKAAWAPARNLANGKPAHDDKEPRSNWIDSTRHSWAGIEPATDPINKWPRIHDLRHSSVGWLLERGVGIDVISRRLGHESIKTTLDVYGHVSPDRLWEAATEIGAALEGATLQLSQ